MALFDGAFGGGGIGILPDWMFNPQLLANTPNTMGGETPAQSFADRWSGVSALPPMQSVDNSPLSIQEMLAGGRMAFAPSSTPAFPGGNLPMPQPRPPDAQRAYERSLISPGMETRTSGPLSAPETAFPSFPQGNEALSGIGNRLVAGGAGFFNAGSPMEALGNLIGGLVTGQRQDPAGIAQQNLLQAQRAAVQYIAGANDIDPNLRAAMLQNPTLAVQWLSARAKPQEYKFEKVGPGESLYAVTPGGPATQIARGGPEKPPTGFEYVNPANPSAGLKPIAGGPATQLPADAAGRLAMLQASKRGLQEAKKYFLSDDFKTGLFDAAGKAIGQATNSFEIGRQQRAIRLAAETALRLATGAAATEEETKRYADLYMPSIYDSKETRQQKLEALERFTSYAERNIGQGRVPPPESFLESQGSITGKPGETITGYGEWQALPGGVRAREIRR